MVVDALKPLAMMYVMPNRPLCLILTSSRRDFLEIAIPLRRYLLSAGSSTRLAQNDDWPVASF